MQYTELNPRVIVLFCLSKVIVAYKHQRRKCARCNGMHMFIDYLPFVESKKEMPANSTIIIVAGSGRWNIA